MGKIESTALASMVRGQVGNLVFRQLYGRTVVSLRREPQPRQRSPDELAGVDRLRQASARAKNASPEMVQRYKERARVEQKPAAAIRMRDYLNPPAIAAVNVDAYQGRPGEIIRVTATDDFEVREVRVTIAVQGAVLEQGVAARRAGDDFEYVATTKVMNEAEVTVEVAVSDWAGNVTTATRGIGVPNSA